MRLGLGLGTTVGRGAPGGGASTFTPATLFANSEAGAWYDPSDTSTLAQNSDGTTSVSVGDPVGYVADKSGNGNHATQATDAARPVLRQDGAGKYYLEFDGADDVLDIGSRMGLVADPTLRIAAAVHWISAPSDQGRFCAIGGESNDLQVAGGPDGGKSWSWRHNGGSAIASSGAVAGETYVALFERSAGDQYNDEDIRINATDLTVSGDAKSPTSTRDSAIIGAGLDQNGDVVQQQNIRLYELVIVNSLNKQSETEQHLADKAGVTL